MSLTRKLLESMGLEADKVSTIIEAHTETTDALKQKNEELKADAEKLKVVEKELSTVKKELETIKEKDGDWCKKYEEEHEAFEKYKNDQLAKEEKSAKEDAYKALLRDTGVSEKSIASIVKVTDLSDVEFVDGAFTKKDELVEGIKSEWEAFITTTSTQGAKTTTPPSTSAGTKMSREDIYKKDEHGRYVLSTAERQKAIAENVEAFSN